MNRAEKFLSKNSSLIRIILILILVPFLLIFLKTLTINYYSDFAVYYGSRVFIDGVNPYIISAGPVHFVYPPSVILLLLPFTIPPLLIAQKIFVIFSMICFFTAIFFLFKLFKVSIFSNLGLFIWILVLNFFPEKFTLGMGQLNNIMFLGLAGFTYFYAKKKDFLSGIFLMIPIIIKLFPLLLIFYLIFKKRWKICLSLLISILFVALFVILIIDPKINIYFFQYVLPDLFGGNKIDYYNQAVSGFLTRQIHNPETVDYIIKIIAAISSIFTLFLVWKNKGSKKLSLLSIGILITLSIIINVYSWQHHFVFLLIPYFITFFYIKNNKLNSRYYFVLGISYILVGLNLKDPLAFPLLLQSHVLYGAILLYLLEIYFLIKSSSNLKYLIRIGK